MSLPLGAHTLVGKKEYQRAFTILYTNQFLHITCGRSLKRKESQNECYGEYYETFITCSGFILAIVPISRTPEEATPL